MRPRSRRLSSLLALLAVALILAAGQADARAGRGGSFGSRGMRSWSTPAPTQTAPRPASPLERSATQPTRPATSQAAGAAAGTRGGLLGSRGGFLGGLLGAGLIGMLLGYGLMGGMGGLASVLGLFLQLGLLAFLAVLAFRFFQSRSRPAHAAAGASPRMATRPPEFAHTGGGGAGAAGGQAAQGVGGDEVGLSATDFDSFERLLGTVQTAYSEEDLAKLRAVTTPEMAGFLEEEIEDNRRRGLANHTAEPKLLQGDLAEAWREGEAEYATVAMRFSMLDWTVDRASGAVVEGDPAVPTEATEVWTFVRTRSGGWGDAWKLAAIQQA